MKNFLKINAVFGIGSVLLGILVAAFERIIPTDNLWVHYISLAGVLIVLCILLMLVAYVISINRKVKLKFNIRKVYDLILENIELKRKINTKLSLEENYVCLNRMLQNIESVSAYYIECQDPTDCIILGIKSQLDYLEKNKNLMDARGCQKLEKIKNNFQNFEANKKKS